ncbi:hypothetical protein CDAR_319611 [Caerostris darwini]|uniref:Uncharacterized protein n=1 Tax=Caerostris darwini TaxID=1538125 RepID=A0AAV4V9G2_9ARAC|nr:hypothetical protein CDAR_319611 [Caerostris darwini]
MSLFSHDFPNSFSCKDSLTLINSILSTFPSSKEPDSTVLIVEFSRLPRSNLPLLERLECGNQFVFKRRIKRPPLNSLGRLSPLSVWIVFHRCKYVPTCFF